MNSAKRRGISRQFAAAIALYKRRFQAMFQLQARLLDASPSGILRPPGCAWRSVGVEPPGRERRCCGSSARSMRNARCPATLSRIGCNVRRACHDLGEVKETAGWRRAPPFRRNGVISRKPVARTSPSAPPITLDRQTLDRPDHGRDHWQARHRRAVRGSPLKRSHCPKAGRRQQGDDRPCPRRLQQRQPR